MHNPTYVQVSRTGVLYFRWPIPKRLHPDGKASTIRVSLRTRDPKEAMRLARFLSYSAHGLSEYGMQAGTQHSEIRAILHRHFARLLEAQKRKMQAGGPLSGFDKSVLEGSQRTGELAVQGRNSLDIVGDDAPTLARLIELYELPIQVGTQPYEWLRSELHKSYRAYCRDTLAYNASLGDYDFNEPETVAKQAAEPEAPAPSIPLSEAIERYTAEALRAGLWRERTEATRRAQLGMLARLLGADVELAKFGKAEARTVSEKLQRVPKNLNKSPAFRGMSLEAVLATAHDVGMNVTTLNDYLNTYSMLFAWSEKQGYVQSDPFDGMQLPVPKTGKKEGKDFSNEQLQIIERTLLTDLDGVPPTQSHKWASLIAMYTGARAGEICQLRATDVQEHDGVPCFSITDEDEGKRVKTQASVRMVPVHSRLIELGLYEFVKKAERGRLFPDYTYSPNYGMSKNLSRWFNEQLLSKLGLKRDGIYLHCLRHTMNTKLHRADVPEPMVKALLGHTDNSMSTGQYFGSGYTKAQLQAAIQKFSIR